MSVSIKLIHLHKRERLLYLLLLLVFISSSSCKKLIEIDPSLSQPSSQVVYKNDATAASVLTGIYADFAARGIVNGLSGISAVGALTADELRIAAGSTTANVMAAYKNSLKPSDDIPFWSKLYFWIYTTNTVLENLEFSPAISAPVKQQLRGESKFIRAFCYFYLVNFFGDVPLVLTADYRVNAKALRTPKVEVWQKIIADLKEAKNLLNSNYVEADAVTTNATTERVRPNSFAATALLARAYLYTGDWVNAESTAAEVINNSIYSLETNLNNVFLKASKEAIWQIQSTQAAFSVNTYDGNVFILTNTPSSSSPAVLTSFLLNAFETGDNRKTSWVGTFTNTSGSYNFPYKYKVKTSNTSSEYLVVLRLAEQYLIRAEARAQQDNIAGAQADLNKIRNRAGLPNTTANDKSSLLIAIQQERRIELFSEWAHRWLDLKRTGMVDAVMTTVAPSKGITWNTNWQLYPIPFRFVIQYNPNLTQNPGYF
jgi:hypothetical protein